ncbi:hypothetical protein Emed_001372 [Eimeria media]
MAAFRNGVLEAHSRSPTGGSDLRVESAFESRGVEVGGVTHRPSKKGPPPGFHRRLFAVSVASLILVFVFLRCFQYVSFVPKVATGSRSLASGSSEEDFCLNWQGDEDLEEGSGDEEEYQEGYPGAAGLPMAAGVAQEGGAVSFEESAEFGWQLQDMPPQWMGRAAGLLHSVKIIPDAFKALLPLLRPSDAVQLCERLISLATMEIASMAYVPSALQPMRAEAQAAIVAMVELVQSKKTAREAARDLRLNKRLRKMKSLIHTLAAIPPNVVFPHYEPTMTSCLNASTYAMTQASAQLQLLLPQQQEQRPPAPQAVNKAVSLLRAIFLARKKQVLRFKPLRDWLYGCQVAIRAPLIQTGPMKKKPSSSSEDQSTQLVDEIAKAILAAGGTPAPSAVTASYVQHSPPSDHPVVFFPSDTDGEDSHETQHSDSSSPEGHSPVPQPAGLEPSQLPHQPSDPDQPEASLQPQAQDQASQPDSVPAPHSPGAADDPSLWEGLGARPRQRAPPVEQPLQDEPGAGYRQVSEQWAARFEEVLELMRTTAITCDSLLPFLSPRQAAWLSMRLSSLAVMHISVFAYIPPGLQPFRQAAGMEYVRLLDRVLMTEPLRSVAAEEKLTSRIQSMRVAIQRLSGIPPDIRIRSSDYMKKMRVNYRECKYALLQALALLQELDPSMPPSSGERLDPDTVIRAVACMGPAFRMQILVDTDLRTWFVSQARNLQHPLFNQEDLDNASKRKGLSTKNFVKRLQVLLIRAGVTPFDLDRMDARSGEEPKPTETSVGEPSSASSVSPAEQHSQQEQPAPPAPQSFLPPPAHDHQPSQTPSMPAFSSQPPAQRAPPSWSAAPPPLFGLHQSPWSWSSADQKHYEQQHPQASSDSPPYFSSTHSFGPTDGGLPGSWDEGQAEESPGGAEDLLSLQELAQLVVEWGLPGAEDQEGQGTSGDGQGELGLLDLAQRVSQGQSSGAKEDQESQGSSDGAEGLLGLQDLAERVLERGLPGAEEGQEGQKTPGDGQGELGLLDLAQRVGALSSGKEDQEGQGSSDSDEGELGLQDLAERVAHGGLSGVDEDQESQGSSGSGAGELGLLDLAQRVSEWDVSDTEEDEEDD